MFLMTSRFNVKRGYEKKSVSVFSRITSPFVNLAAKVRLLFDSRTGTLISTGVLAAATLAAAIYAALTLTAPLALVAYADGIRIGAVDGHGTVADALSRANAEFSEADRESISGMLDVTYRFERVRGEDTLSADECSAKLAEYIAGYYSEAYALSIDGSYIGACADKADVSSVIERLEAEKKQEYTNSGGDGTCFYLENNVDITYSLCPQNDIISANELYERLSRRNLSGIANVLSAPPSDPPRGADTTPISDTSDASVALLPQETAMPDAELGKHMPTALTYVLEEGEEAIKTIPYGTVYFEDATLAKGISVMTTEGVDGVQKETYNSVLLPNGDTEKRVASTEIITVKTDCVWRIGTADAPECVATGSYIWPLNGTVITSEFGDDRSEYAGIVHHGIDIDGNKGDRIYAADGGTVIFSGYKGSLGLTIIIDHGNGVNTIYAHQSKLNMFEGEAVYKGQVIGSVGTTGVATGSHLHFELRVDGESVDPLQYMPPESYIE